MTASANDRRVRKTKTALEQAFLELVAERGINGITVKELAERADVTRKTFYLHYPSIDAFVDEMISEKLPESFSREPQDYVHGTEFDFLAFLTDLTEFLDAHDGYYLTLLTDRACYEVFASMLHTYLDVNRSKRISGSLTEEQTELCITFMAAGLCAMYYEWVRGPREVTLEQLATIAEAMLQRLVGLA